MPGFRISGRRGARSWLGHSRCLYGSASSPWDGRSPTLEFMLGESFRPYFEWCGTTWLGTIVRDTVWAFPLIETFHLLALALLLGSVLIVNLRVFGVAKQYLPAAQIARQLEPWMLWSIGVLIATGI